MRPGDHIKVRRPLYSHHGIFVARDEVIHYSGELKNKEGATIRRASLEEFAAGGTVEVVEYARRRFVHEETVERARSRLDESGYRFFGNNCEHFARWCVTGEHASEQVDDARAAGTGVGGGAAATAAGLGTAAAVGVGYGGAATMSGLATVGSVVGGGAVAGLVTLGAAPAIASTLAMRRALKDDPSLSDAERSARRLGRHATVGGAALGAVGTVATISASGAVAGLSGAGITSGLAAIGGGSMAAGTVVAVAAPAVAAAAVGYGIYRFFKWAVS